MAEKEALQPQIVKDFVGNAHGNLGRVQELLATEPTLINAAWDWGGGDWETALGAAAHMGRRDIAVYLLQQGARIDLYAAAMLGHLEMVKAILAAAPQQKDVPGPHGISLLTHATKGGAEAKAVVEFLGTLATQ